MMNEDSSKRKEKWYKIIGPDQEINAYINSRMSEDSWKIKKEIQNIVPDKEINAYIYSRMREDSWKRK